MAKPNKQKTVTDLQEALGKSPDLILTGYRGLTVKEITQLRRAIAPSGGRMKVVKKTLFLRVLKDDERAGLEKYLEGPVAVTFVSGDSIAALKAINTFARAHSEVDFKGGWIQNHLFAGDQLVELAALPPREELLGRLVGILSAPLSQLLGALQAVPRDLVLTLQSIAKQREEVGASAGA